MERQRWNARHEASVPEFVPHPLVAAAIAAGLPDGDVLELACGPSGSALALAEAGRSVLALDVSDVALAQLSAEARRRGLESRVLCVHADAADYPLDPDRFALVLCTRFWDAAVFASAAAAVAPGGVFAWEALCETGSGVGPFRIRHGELSARLPAGFDVLEESAGDSGAHAVTQILARRGSGLS